MKAVKFDLLGKTRYLCYTVEAMFRLQEEFGGVAELVDAVQSNSRDGLAAVCKTAVILAEQGELGRRSLGYDPEPVVDADTLAATLGPGELVALKLAIPAAISLGFGREVDPENDEVDLFMAELNAQKNLEPQASYLRIGLTCGLSKRDTLLSTPGELGDLWELYLKDHGGKRKRENN